MGPRGRAVALCSGLLIVGCTTAKSSVTATGGSPLEGVPTATTEAGRTSEPTGSTTPAGGTDAEVPGSETPIAADPKVAIAHLDNGLTVYVRHNEHPGGSVELRLVINAGSALEEPDQAGVAHFLEHMMFNGTEHYPANELIDTLQGFGMEFGADVNAYTDFDETVYELTVPTAEPKNLTAGIDILAEWLGAATLDPAQVTSERGVVLDEWRQSDATLDGRVFDAAAGMFLAGSPYDGRKPIGSDSAINAMTPELLRRFYDRWYRPDNAAVVIVGDVDAKAVVAQIRGRFDGLEPRGDAVTHPNLSVVVATEPDAIVHLDPDAVDASVELSLPVMAVEGSSQQAARRSTIESMAFAMIANRISDDISRGKLPFTSAQTSSNDLVRALDAPSVQITATPDRATDAVQTVVDEFERVSRFGFGQGELDRVIAGYRSSTKSDHESADSRQDSDFVGGYVDNFLTGAPIPTSDDEFTLISDILDHATVADVAAALQRRRQASAPKVLVVAPQDVESTVPTAADVLAVLAGASERPLERRPDEQFSTTALMTAPEPVKEASDVTLASDSGSYLEARILTFPNGARVVLNTNKIADQQVAFGATSPGGLSLVAPADMSSAQLMAEVAQNSGYGELDAVQTQAVLANASAGLQAYLDATSENLTGGSATADLETLFQLVHLSFTGARFDQAALKSSLASWKGLVDNPASDADAAAAVALAAARYGDDPVYRVVPTRAEFDSIDLATMKRVWAERFGGANDWVFVFSGDFDRDKVVELARRYIGTLPGGGPVERWIDHQPDPPATVVETEVVAGTGQHAGLTQLYTATSDGSVSDRVQADLLSIILSSRLTDHVREQLGATYSPSASASIVTEPDDIVETYVDVSGAPDGLAKLSEVVRADIADLAGHGPTAADLSEAKAQLKQKYQYFDNGTWVDVLLGGVDDNNVIADYLDQPSVLGDITVESAVAFAARVLPTDHFIEVRVRPG